MATYTLDVSTPASSDAPTGGDDRIRELKNALHERLNKDGYWEKSGNTIDADNVGYQRKSTLLVQATAPTAKANAGIIYSKDVSGKAELFYRDEDGDEVQLTSGGAINVDSAFASTDFILSALSSKTGWTDRTTTYAGKYLRIGATALATGGNASKTVQGSSFSFTGSAVASGNPSDTSNCSDEGGACSKSQCALTHKHTTTAAGTIGGSAAVALTPVFCDVRFFQKN